MRALGILLTLASISPSTWAQISLAERVEFWVSLGLTQMPSPGIGSLDAGGTRDDITVKGGLRIAVRYAFEGDGHFGQEVHYDFSRASIGTRLEGITVPDPKMGIHTAGFNELVYFTPFHSRIRPFATGGVQFTDFVPPGGDPYYRGSAHYGFNYGGGVKFYLARHVALRVDARQFSTSRPFKLIANEGAFRQNEFSAGLGYVF